MNKPTNKKDYPFVVECENQEQTKTVLNHYDENNDRWPHWKYVVIMDDSNPGVFETKESFNSNLKIITYSEWLQLPDYTPEEVGFKEPEGQSEAVPILKKISGIDKEFVLPENWGIRGCEELRKYFIENKIDLQGDYDDQYYWIKENNDWDADMIEYKDEAIQLITFDQFKEHVLGYEFKQEMKEVIGYKLIKDNTMMLM